MIQAFSPGLSLRVQAFNQGDRRKQFGGPARPARNFLAASRKKKLSPSSGSSDGPSASNPPHSSSDSDPKKIGDSSSPDAGRESSPAPSTPNSSLEARPYAQLPEESSAPSEPPKGPVAALPTPENSAVSEQPWPTPQAPEEAPPLKDRLIRLVASLDRGLSATRGAKDEVDQVTRQLERAWPRFDLKRNPFPLAGKWRLIYSSAFSGGSLGGSRPGPSANLVPFTLGQVYQRVQVGRESLSNIVELIVGPPATPFPLNNLGLEPLVVQVNLGHEFTMVDAQTSRIVYNATTVRTRGGPGGIFRQVPPLTAPELPDFLRPPPVLRSAQFTTTYLDEDFRVSRGDRGELRIYVKAE